MWKKKIYIKGNLSPFALSRTKIDLFIDCRKCFYNEIVRGIKRPQGPPMALNNAVIYIIKKEFEDYRELGKKHEIFSNLGKDIVYANNKELNDWKNMFKGIRYVHKNTNLELFGTIDELWFDEEEQTYSVVSIKATSKKEELNLEDIPSNYWRQLSFYHYLLKKNNFRVSDSGYIIYCNAIKNTKRFESRLMFSTNLFSNNLKYDWIEEKLSEIFEILQGHNHPPPSKNCKYCEYVNLTNLKI